MELLQTVGITMLFTTLMYIILMMFGYLLYIVRSTTGDITMWLTERFVPKTIVESKDNIITNSI